MSDQTRRRRPSSHTSALASHGESAPELTGQRHNSDASTNQKLPAPAISGTYTLSRGPRLRPFQFEGEIIAEVENDATDPNGRNNEHGRVSLRAAIYRTRKGTIVTEISSLDHTGGRTGKADVFGSLDDACEWFRPGPLTTELLEKLGRWQPEIIEQAQDVVK